MITRLGYIEQFENGYMNHFDKVLSKSEINDYNSAIAELHNYEKLKRLFEIVILNNNEFIRFIEIESVKLFDNSLSASGDKKSHYEHHLHLNRLFLNYLTSFRSFTDHTEMIVKRKYGAESTKVIKYKEFTGHLFDTYFSYRFLSKLRNYAQHCGLPIDNFELSATAISKDTFRREYKIEFITADLLSNFDSWGSVKKDLLKYESFSIFPILEEMIDAIQFFWGKLICLFQEGIENSIHYLVSNAGHLKTSTNSVCLFRNTTNDQKDNSQYFSSETIPFDIIESIKSNGDIHS